MMKWLVKKKSDQTGPNLNMLTDDPLATLELGIGSIKSPEKNRKSSAGIRKKRTRKRNRHHDTRIYSVSRTNPLYDGDKGEYKSSSDTSGYSSRDQHLENTFENDKDFSEARLKIGDAEEGDDDDEEEDEDDDEETEDDESSSSSLSSNIRESFRRKPTHNSFINAQYVKRIIVNDTEICPASTYGPSEYVHNSSLVLAPIGEEDKEDAFEDSIVTNSLLAMTSENGSRANEYCEVESEVERRDSDYSKERRFYITYVYLNVPFLFLPQGACSEKKENMDEVIRELSEAVVQSRNVLSLTRAVSNKNTRSSISSRDEEYFRVREINGLQVVNLDEVPSMDSGRKKVQFIEEEERRAKKEDGRGIAAFYGNDDRYDGLATILDVNLLNQQTYWESYYGLQRELVIDGKGDDRYRDKRSDRKIPPPLPRHERLFANNFVLESVSPPHSSMENSYDELRKSALSQLSKKSSDRTRSKNPFYILSKKVANSSCFWKSFWIITGFGVVLITTIATSIYVTKSLVQKQ